ncbi:MAG TPA: hypothetical protein VJ550_16700 [Geomonas sp.]|nr:hypothetical protein [Geomonas sp.]
MAAKEEVRRILDKLPDDATLEDIQRHINLRQQTGKGAKGGISERALDEDEFDVKITEWMES